MEQLIAMLREEAKLFDNVEAAAILLRWDTEKVMRDVDFYAAARIRKARLARQAAGKANAKARREAKAARENAEASKAEADAARARVLAARDRVKAKLARP